MIDIFEEKEKTIKDYIREGHILIAIDMDGNPEYLTFKDEYIRFCKAYGHLELSQMETSVANKCHHLDGQYLAIQCRLFLKYF